MLFPEIHELETPRLRLRKLTLEDVPMYYERLGSSTAVTKYMLWNPHQDISESIASLQKVLRRYEEGRCYRWGITLRDTDSLIGIIDLLRFEEETGTCSFAYMLGEAFWGLGYGTEAVKAVLRFAFEEMGAIAVIADHMTANPASGAVMRKAGMSFVQTLVNAYEKEGILHDADQYRITREEWLPSNS